jgi:hypothetical protein
VPFNSSEMCHFLCTNKIHPNFINVLLFNFADNFKPNNSASRIFPLALFKYINKYISEHYFPL